MKFYLSIWKKEWIKTRTALLILLPCLVLYTLYILYPFMQPISAGVLNKMWEVMIERNIVFVEGLKYIPVSFGILLALAQMIPETLQKRLKLTLHLPYSDQCITNALLSYGWVLTLMVALFIEGVTFMVTAPYLPYELVRRILLTALPWCMAGVVGYSLICWVVLESTLLRRILFGILSVGFVHLYFLASFPESETPGMLLLLFLLVVYSAMLPHYSITRYRLGQN